ncbi:hypothetical protein pipiens_015464, partial [Culex pipiens pipiens]
MHPVVLLSMANHLSRTGNMGNRMGAARLLTDLGRAGHVFLDHDYLGTSYGMIKKAESGRCSETELAKKGSAAKKGVAAAGSGGKGCI